LSAAQGSAGARPRQDRSSSGLPPRGAPAGAPPGQALRSGVTWQPRTSADKQDQLKVKVSTLSGEPRGESHVQQPHVTHGHRDYSGCLVSRPPLRLPPCDPSIPAHTGTCSCMPPPADAAPGPPGLRPVLACRDGARRPYALRGKIKQGLRCFDRQNPPLRLRLFCRAFALLRCRVEWGALRRDRRGRAGRGGVVVRLRSRGWVCRR
jgi:hypothetical protein